MSKARARGKPGKSPSSKSATAKSPAVAPRTARRRSEPEPGVRISKPGDHHEREADAAAERIVSGQKATSLTPVAGVGRQAAGSTQGEEKDKVQTAAKDEKAPEDEKVQKADDKAAEDEKKDEVQSAEDTGEKAPEEEVQKAEDTGEKQPEEEVQTKAEGGGSMAHAAQQAIANRGPGRPMHAPTRTRVESGLGTDLSHVRVHDDAAAQTTARSLNARAFTHGNDVWLGRNESDRDVHLMAHESAHVLQQQGSVRRAVVQRDTPATTPPSGTETRFTSTTNKGEIDTSTNPGRVTLPQVKLPAWKTAGPDGLSAVPSNPIPKSGTRDTTQVSQWESAVRPGISSTMNAKLDRAEVIREGGTRLHFLAYKGAGGGYLIGSKSQITQRARRPDWDQEGRPHYYDVDHFQEMQVGGADSPSNFWLLDAQANQTSGGAIDREVTSRVAMLLAEAGPYLGSNAPANAAAVRETYNISITQFTGGLTGWSGDPSARWTKKEVEDGKPVDALNVLTEAQARSRNLIGPGAESILTVFTSARGGASVQVGWDPATNTPKTAINRLTLWPAFAVNGLTWTGTAGTVTGVAFKGSKYFDEAPVTLDMEAHSALPQAAVVNGRHIESKIRSTLEMKTMSPVQLTTVEMRDGVGIYATGVLRPTLPIFRGVEIDILIEGNQVTFQKQFTSDELSLPGPIRVTETSLILGAGTRGLTLSGQALFEVERLGKGKLGAEAGVSLLGAGFSVEGEFEFDTELFDKAKIKAWYRESKFGGEGRLEIGKGKFKGIDGATLTATIDGEKIDAVGTVKVAIKGVEQGTLTFKYDPTIGMEIGGTLQLSGDIPGIASGSLEAKLSKGPDGPWKLAGAITATPSIPGVTGSISGQYDDGAFLVQGTIAYEKGMLAGSVTVGATNRNVDESGQPTGDATDNLIAFGRGEVTIKIAPWLQGTIGLQLKPNGEILVSGEVKLPDSVDLFPEKKVEKEIFSVDIKIPIVGLSVAGQSIGIFASIGGGLTANASIGPGQLRQLGLRVQYNPDNEAETMVTGGAQLYIPAKAGLRLFVTGGLGVGIPLVDATAGLEVGGTLGVEGAAEANVEVNWSPANGLAIDADVGVHAQPSFTFDVTGFVKVEFDYYFGSETLYEKRWQLASFKYGSDLRFGIKFPFHYQEGEPFDVSLSDVEFEYPEIDAQSVLSALVDQIA